jgi:hypothetical protein
MKKRSTKTQQQAKGVANRSSAETLAPPAYPPTWIVFLSIAVIVWVARYWQCANFGFYEDDAARIPGAMEMDFAGVLEVFRSHFMMEVGQGRPLHDGLIVACSFLAGRIGGIFTLYLLGFIVVSINGCLAYLLLRRLDLGPLFAVLGTLVWILYPVDTNTQLYLTLVFGGQFSLTFFLLASHAWLSDRRILAYALIAPTLFCYETVFPVFLAVPLLSYPWDRRIIKPLAIHSVTMFAMVAGIGVLRTLTEATVMATPTLEHALTWPFRQMAVGVRTALTVLISRPITQLFASRAGHWFALLPLGVALLLAISEVKDSARDPRQLLRSHGRMILVGLLMLAFSYALAFTSGADTLHGRGTRVHMPGVIGAALLGGAFCSALLLLARMRSGRLAVEFVLAILFTGMAGFAWKIQDDYAMSWARQRAFWADVLRLAPDVGEGELILVGRPGLRSDGEIEAVGWSLMDNLALMYQIPADWRLPPVAAYLRDDWRYANRYGRRVQHYIMWAGLDAQYAAYKQSDFIILEVVDGKLTRLTEPIRGDNGVIVPKLPGEPVITRLPRRRLASYLELRTGEVPVDYTR